MLGEPFGGQHHPAVLLRAGVRAVRARRVDLGPRTGDGVGGHVACGRIGLGDQRQHRGGVAQARAVIGPGKPGVLLGRERSQRGGEDLAGAGAVAEHRQRRAELSLGERRRERVELGVGQIAQVADHRPAVARQHVERIGERGVVGLVRFGRVDDGVAQAIERLPEGPLGDHVLLLAGAGQEVGDEGVEPGVVVLAVGRPQAEGAAGALAAHLALDRLVHTGARSGSTPRFSSEASRLA